MECAGCGTSFSARCDAVHCSGACRQKAHRARTARRVDALRDRLGEESEPGPMSREAAQSLQRAVDSALRRVERSRELCRTSGESLRQRTAAPQYWPAPAAGKAPPWPGI